MCGFVGTINLSHDLNHKILIKEANNLLKKRGPDSEGFFQNNFCKFGFRRLSIIDLSESGNQPMTSNDGRYICMFNGEIYNYKKLYNELENSFKWKSKTDTEVLLNSYIFWGKKFVSKLDGMFSFVILDLKRKELFCSRDKLGEKPFFYHKEKNNFYFASNLSALEKICNKKFLYDNNSVNDFITYGHCDSQKTIFKDVFKLQPGCNLTLTENSLKIENYWDQKLDQLNKENNPSTFENFDQIFKRSIREKMNSDRPVGIFLSSGIDSSLVAKLAKNELGKIKTFSIGFDDEKYDESNLARKFSKKLESDHHEKIISHSDIIKEIPNLSEKFDEPVADPSLIPTYLMTKFAKENMVDVCLSGDGGDELFGGYNYYTLMKIKSSLSFLPSYLFNFLNYLPVISSNHKMILLKEFLIKKDLESSFKFLKCLNKDLPNVIKEEYLENDLFKFKIQEKENLINDILKYDMKNNLIENYLIKLDRSSMSNSLECRLPFLSDEIINFCQNLDVNDKISLLNKKVFLKKYARKYLPNYILDKKKRGFETPIKEWLRGKLKDWAEDLILDTSNYHNLPINKNIVEKLFKLHLSKKRDVHPYLWSILMVLEFNKNRNIKMQIS